MSLRGISSTLNFEAFKTHILYAKPIPKARFVSISGIPTRAQKFWASASSCEERPLQERLSVDVWSLKREDWKIVVVGNLKIATQRLPKTVIFQRSYLSFNFKAPFLVSRNFLKGGYLGNVHPFNKKLQAKFSGIKQWPPDCLGWLMTWFTLSPCLPPVRCEEYPIARYSASIMKNVMHGTNLQTGTPHKKFWEIPPKFQMT